MGARVEDGIVHEPIWPPFIDELAPGRVDQGARRIRVEFKHAITPFDLRPSGKTVHLLRGEPNVSPS